MKDVAKMKPKEEIEIEKVGIKELSYPIKVFDKQDTYQSTVGKINMYASLPKQFRGTHMSRFIEVLNNYRETIALKHMKPLLKHIKKSLSAFSAHIEIDFPYFIQKTAPKSGAQSLMKYNCKFICSINQRDEFEFVLGVNVPITTLCPCSKELVEKGAHNQRTEVRVEIKSYHFFWIEDLVKIVEECASARIYTLLKREDEAFITQQAYSHPMFVEDVVREVAVKLENEEDVYWYAVEVESYESIHNHNAYASIRKHKSILKQGKN